MFREQGERNTGDVRLESKRTVIAEQPRVSMGSAADCGLRGAEERRACVVVSNTGGGHRGDLTWKSMPSEKCEKKEARCHPDEVNDEESKDVNVLRGTSPRTTSLATSRIPIVSRPVKTKTWNTEFQCRNFNRGIAGKTAQVGLRSLESRRDSEGKTTKSGQNQI